MSHRYHASLLGLKLIHFECLLVFAEINLAARLHIGSDWEVFLVAILKASFLKFTHPCLIIATFGHLKEVPGFLFLADAARWSSHTDAIFTGEFYFL